MITQNSTHRRFFCDDDDMLLHCPPYEIHYKHCWYLNEAIWLISLPPIMILTYQPMKVKRQHHNLSCEWTDVEIRTNIQNGKVDSVRSSTPAKICIASKKALNKSCSKLNFIPRNPRVEMSISPRSGARGLERFPSLKIVHYYFLKVRIFWALAPLQGKIDIYARWLYCTKFNFEQLLFKAFFDATLTFRSVEPQTT